MTIKIAHVNVSRGFRGGERQTELLIDKLVDAEVQQVLVARRGEPLATRCANKKVEVRQVAGNVLAVLRATHDVDVVHVHEGRSVYGAWLRSLASGTPYVLTRRVNNPIGTHWLARSAYRRAGRVVAVAHDIAAIVQRYDSQISVEVIHSGSSGLAVDAVTSAAIRDRFPHKFIVGNVGALDNQQKGQEYIIRVARELEASHPHIQFVLVGGGGDEQMLKTEATGLTNLSFEGFVDNVGDYLAAFDIFILPSNKEGIGGILLDAMEQSLAVVASRVGGLPEIVTDRANGLLIDPARPDQLKAAILELAGSKELRNRLGEHGQEFARGFSAAVMAQKYLSVYRSLVKGQ